MGRGDRAVWPCPASVRRDESLAEGACGDFRPTLRHGASRGCCGGGTSPCSPRSRAPARSPCCVVPPSPAEGPPSRAQSRGPGSSRRPPSRGWPGARMIRAAVAGVMAASPRATASIMVRSCAASRSLSRYPRAPARMAANRSSSSSLTVSMTIGVSGRRRAISRVASTPDMPGIRTSIRTRSGSSRTTRSTASRPSAALADDVMAPRP